MENNTKTENTESFSLYHYVKSKWKNIFILMLLALVIIVYLGSNIKVKEQRKKYTEIYNDLYQAAVNFSEKQDSYYLKQVAHLFLIAIKSEMCKSNFEKVNIISTSVLKSDERIVEIVISNAEGLIVSCTNKKHENKIIMEYFPYNYISLSRIVVVPAKVTDNLMILCPLFELNEPIGVLIIKYKPVVFSFKGMN